MPRRAATQAAVRWYEIDRTPDNIRQPVDTRSQTTVMKFATVIKLIRVERAVCESFQPSYALRTKEIPDGKVVHKVQYSGDPFDPSRSRAQGFERMG